MDNVLIARAEGYLELAKYALSRGLYSHACFLSSVAAELFMKGVSLAVTGDFSWFHYLKHILSHMRNVNDGLREEIDSFMRENRAKLWRLADEYTMARYYEEANYKREDAEACIRFAEEVFEFGKKLVKAHGGNKG